jgi:hypothetical protein
MPTAGNDIRRSRPHEVGEHLGHGQPKPGGHPLRHGHGLCDGHPHGDAQSDANWLGVSRHVAVVEPVWLAEPECVAVTVRNCLEYVDALVFSIPLGVSVELSVTKRLSHGVCFHDWYAQRDAHGKLDSHALGDEIYDCHALVDRVGHADAQPDGE